MRRLGLIGALIVLMTFSGRAQQWVGHGSLDTIRIHLQLTNQTDFEHQQINKALRAIAYSQQKPPETVQVDWDIVASYQVLREEQGQFKSDIFLKPLLPQGDVKLYNFSSANYLLPQLTAFRLRVFKEDSSLVYLKYYKDVQINAASVGNIARFSIWHQRWAKGWYMKIDQFAFDYQAAEYSFSEWFEYANDYQAANYLVDKLLKSYDDMQQKPQEVFPFLIKSIRQVNSLKKVYQLPFYKALILKKQDPEGLEQKMGRLSTLYDLNILAYAQKFLQSSEADSSILNHLVDTYLNENYELFSVQQQYPGMYDQLFEKIRGDNYPANLQYKDFDLIGSTEVVSTLDKKQLQTAFENAVYEKSMIKLNALIDEQAFTEALFFVDNLEGFRKNAHAFERTDAFMQAKARAAYGLYYSYVKVMDQALKIGNINMAVTYIEKATAVQQKYPKQIITNGLVERKLRLLLDTKFAEYQKCLDGERHAEASARREVLKQLIQQFKLEGTEAIFEVLNAYENRAQKN